MSLVKVFQSSIGRKLIMGLTGLFLISFLIIHVTINSTIFLNDHGTTFNDCSHFMSHNWIVRFLEIGLLAGLLLHIVQGALLTFANQKTRPTKYAVNPGNATSKWYSRSMGILGSLLLIFLAVHLSQFWAETKYNVLFDGDKPVNGFNELKETFENIWVVIIYICGVIALAWHLIHGFPSAFQTLGINNSKYNALIKYAGYAYTVIISILFILMPLSLHFGWLK
jgi:succinate dehydrogenase / fumarate reductase, cytochrome b subunit